MARTGRSTAHALVAVGVAALVVAVATFAIGYGCVGARLDHPERGKVLCPSATSDSSWWLIVAEATAGIAVVVVGLFVRRRRR